MWTICFFYFLKIWCTASMKYIMCMMALQISTIPQHPGNFLNGYFEIPKIFSSSSSLFSQVVSKNHKAIKLFPGYDIKNTQRQKPEDDSRYTHVERRKWWAFPVCLCASGKTVMSSVFFRVNLCILWGYIYIYMSFIEANMLNDFRSSMVCVWHFQDSRTRKPKKLSKINLPKNRVYPELMKITKTACTASRLIRLSSV